MRDGRLEQVDRPEEIYAAPASAFVPDFIGITNLLRCRVLSSESGLVDWEGERLTVGRLAAGVGDTVMVSVRPEKIALGGAAGAESNRIEGVVEVITFLGPVVRVEVAARGRALWVDVPHAAAATLARRKPVTLAFAPADCVVLPAG
jgi:ABC-type Fe3+/spermidine/putrescine transport system ATPase subunit